MRPVASHSPNPDALELVLGCGADVTGRGSLHTVCWAQNCACQQSTTPDSPLSFIRTMTGCVQHKRSGHEPMENSLSPAMVQVVTVARWRLAQIDPMYHEQICNWEVAKLVHQWSLCRFSWFGSYLTRLEGAQVQYGERQTSPSY